MKVKIKKVHESAVIPEYAKSGDAGLDLTCTERHYDKERNQMTYSTGLAIEIPKGYVGLLFPRSSIYKYELSLTNAVGVVDSGYRGEIKMIFRNHMNYAGPFEPFIYNVGDRVGQLVILPYPMIELEETEELSDSERGALGHGSSGK